MGGRDGPVDASLWRCGSTRRPGENWAPTYPRFAERSVYPPVGLAEADGEIVGITLGEGDSDGLGIGKAKVGATDGLGLDEGVGDAVVVGVGVCVGVGEGVGVGVGIRFSQ